jgi:hypothetical protein
MRKLSILIFFLACCQSGWSQNGKPPAIQIAGGNQKILIDSLIKASKYETYFIKYCSDRIDEAAKDQQWTQSKIQSAKKLIDFDQFKNTFYNVFSFLSDSQIEDITRIMADLNKSKNNSFFYFMTNSMIQNNLEMTVKNYINEAG